MRIITDSMSDIRQKEGKALGIDIVPLYVIFAMYSYLDDVTLPREEFYRRLRAGELPKTSQATPADFHKRFRQALAQGDEVLCITGSSGVSGTYQSAVIARDMLEQPEKVHIVDSLSGNAGETLLVEEALRLREAGHSVAEIEEQLRALVPRVRLVAQVESLKHLALGGRLGSGTARVGDLLHLKPLLQILNGKVDQLAMVRGRKRTLEWFANRIVKEQPRDERYPVCIASCDAPEALGQLRDGLCAAGICAGDIREMGVGCVIGTHTGPGCLVMAWIERE